MPQAQADGVIREVALVRHNLGCFSRVVTTRLRHGGEKGKSFSGYVDLPELLRVVFWSNEEVSSDVGDPHRDESRPSLLHDDRLIRRVHQTLAVDDLKYPLTPQGRSTSF